MLCSFGCGQEAKFNIEVKPRCSKSHNSCPANKKKNSLAVAKSRTPEAIQEKQKQKEELDRKAIQEYGLPHEGLTFSQKRGMTLKEKGIKPGPRTLNTTIEKNLRRDERSQELFRKNYAQLTTEEKKRVGCSFRTIRRNKTRKPHNVEWARKQDDKSLETFGRHYKELTMNERKQVSSLLKYGVTHHMKSATQKAKFITTSIQKFGCAHPMQQATIFKKNQLSCFSRKPYVFPSGKIILIQGYEGLAIDKLLKGGSIKESDILTSPEDMPKVFYLDPLTKVRRRYYPDIYIPRLNWIIEVKSIVSWNLNPEQLKVNLAKRNACKQLGFNFNFIYL